MTHEPDEHDAALRKLERLFEEMSRKHETTAAELEALREVMHGWTSEDTEEVKEVLRLRRGFRALGALGGIAKNIVLWVGIMVAGLLAFRSGMLDFLGIGKP